jgi:hypothetical protein
MLAFFLLILGMIDLGIGVFRFNQVSHAARHGARQVIVHGKHAPSGWNGGPWGITKLDCWASDVGTPIADALRPMLVGSHHDKTRIQVEWLETSNEVERNVRVTVTTPYQPILFNVFGAAAIDLSASSTMPIAH